MVELKAIEALAPVHDAQLITYLRLGGWRLGLLINFNVPVLKMGFIAESLAMKLIRPQPEDNLS